MEADQHAGAPERRRRTAIGLGLEHRAHCEAGNLTPAVKNRELLFRRSNMRLTAVRVRVQIGSSPSLEPQPGEWLIYPVRIEALQTVCHLNL
jgi:hypothetical protein